MSELLHLTNDNDKAFVDMLALKQRLPDTTEIMLSHEPTWDLRPCEAVGTAHGICSWQAQQAAHLEHGSSCSCVLQAQHLQLAHLLLGRQVVAIAGQGPDCPTTPLCRSSPRRCLHLGVRMMRG